MLSFFENDKKSCFELKTKQDFAENLSICRKYKYNMRRNERFKIKLKGIELEVCQPSWKSVVIIFMVLVFGVLMSYGLLIFT